MATRNSLQPIRDGEPVPPSRAVGISGREEILESAESIGTSGTERSQLLEISNAMVALYKEAFGRGPTKVRARFAEADTLLITLESSLTVAERNLVAMGEHRRLREARLFLADALEGQARAIVERALGRKTVAYVSGLDTARDVTIHLFTLEPVVETSVPGAPETVRLLRKPRLD